MVNDVNQRISNLEEERKRLQAQADQLQSAKNFQSVKPQFNKVVNRIMAINSNINAYKQLSKSGYSSSQIGEIVSSQNLQRQRTIAQQQTAKETGLSVSQLKARAQALKKPAQKGTAIQVISAKKQKEIINKQNALTLLLSKNQQSNPLFSKLQNLQSRSQSIQQKDPNKIKSFLLKQSGYNVYENKVKESEKQITNSIQNYTNVRQGFYQRQVDDGRLSVAKATELLNKDVDQEYNKLINKNEFFREKNARVQTTNALSYQYETDRLEALKRGEKLRADALLFLREVADTPSALVKAGVSVKNYLQKLSRDPKTRETSTQTLKKVFFPTEQQKIERQKIVNLKVKEFANFVITTPSTAIAQIGGSMVGFGILSKGSKPVLKAINVFSKKASKEIVKQLNIKPFVVKGVSGFSKIKVELSPTIISQIKRAVPTSVKKVARKIKPKPLPAIKQIEKGTKTIKNINSIAKDIKELIPKNVPKVRASKVEMAMKPIIERFLKDKRVLLALRKKYPKKTKFTLKEIKTIRFYPQLKSILRRRVFSKFEIKRIRKKRGKVKPAKRTIRGVKVGRREFKTFQEADKQFQSFKRLGKFVKRIKNKGGAGKIESLPKRPINEKELQYFKVARKIPRPFFKDVKDVAVTTFVQKFTARIPIIKRFGSLKKGSWKLILEDKTFYQNSVSFSLYKKGAKPIGTITFNTLSSKPITRFRSLENALRWGTNKNIILSKSVGKNFVRSFVLRSRGAKITAGEFLSKIKVTPKGSFQDILIKTKKIPRVTSRKSVKKQFERAIPVSATKGRIRKFKVPTIVKWNKKKGYLEITQRGRTIKTIKTKSIINPVIIDTSKIETIVRNMNKIKMKTLSKAKTRKIKQAKKLILSTPKSKSFVLNGRKKVAIPKAKLKQIQMIEKETRTALKESLAGRSISPRIKVTKRVQGIKQLKKLQKTEKALKKVRGDLIKRRSLDSASKTAISQSMRIISKMKTGLRMKQNLQTILKGKQIRKQIQGLVQVQKLNSRSALKVISVVKKELPMIPIPIIRSPKSIPKPKPKLKKPFLIKPKKKLVKGFKTFSKPVKIFNVIVKKRGKNVILKDKLTERDALNLMALELDDQLLRSARLKQIGKSKKARKISPKYNGAFEKRKRKLRQYKLKKKRKVAIRGFIEKKRFALDTPREKAQLKRTRRKSVKKKRPVRKKKIVRKKKKVVKKIVRRKTTRRRIRRK